ncbi:glycosyltransferase family 4 protein [Vibrio cyclitrophicus]|uniref:glycosyltransferase n=1 Tax=Vibrio cyclitrophicus TaxID=47951 RepID=UPI00148C7177|nr:glycosyltransferase family 4 protein [Vibrio cyclitrophicus]
MKLGIDIRWMVNNHRGMGRFAEFLIKPVKDKITAFAPHNMDSTNYNVVKKGNSFFPWWEQCILPFLSKKEKVDYIIFPYNTGPIIGCGKAKKIVVIHDLIFMRSKSELPLSMSLYQTLGRYYRRLVVPKVAKNSDVIITVSEYTKSELIGKLNISESKIKVIPNSISNKWFGPYAGLSERKPYLFTVAGEAPSKNVPKLIEAFSLAKKHIGNNVTLRIAGIKVAHHSEFIEIAKKFKIESDVEFLGFISDHELQLQYREARLFIFASLFEGFGIPLLEAMASGTPVCCSNSTSLPEVVGDASLLFDPCDVNDISKSIIDILTEEISISENRVSKAYSRAGEFSESAVNKQIKVFWRKYCDSDC